MEDKLIEEGINLLRSQLDLMLEMQEDPKVEEHLEAKLFQVLQLFNKIAINE
jgi:hypothetical protein